MNPTEEELEAATYLRGVKTDAGTTLAMIAALLAASSKVAATVKLRRTLAALGAAHDGLQRAWRSRQYAARALDPRPYDAALDRAWAAMVARLMAWAQLPEERSPEVARAAEVVAVVAPDGLAVLKLPYRLQWSSLKARLDEVHERGLDDALAALAGDAFVAEVRERFEDYGRVLGITEAPADEEAQVNLSALLRAAQARLNDYVIQVLATTDADDPATVRAAREALRPILETREYVNGSRSAADAKPDAKPAEPDAKPAEPVVTKSQRPVAPQRPSAPPPA